MYVIDAEAYIGVAPCSFTFDLVCVWLCCSSEPPRMAGRPHRPICRLSATASVGARTPKGNRVHRPEPGDRLCQAPLQASSSVGRRRTRPAQARTHQQRLKGPFFCCCCSSLHKQPLNLNWSSLVEAEKNL